jgi:drug/metabolite transporter (DMT)-like permease
MIHFSVQRYALLALVAAALFGASTPLAKPLLGEISPVALAGLLYLGSGLGLLALHASRVVLARAVGRPDKALPASADWPWLAGGVLSGGILAPILLMWGLSGTPAAEASLLLNFEIIATTLIAAFLFHEAVGGRIWIAALLMLAAGFALSWLPQAELGFSLHALAIVGSCVCWGVDNNLTRRISANDPVALVMIKGLTAGTFNLALAFALGFRLPAVPVLASALVLGFVAYGLSLVLFVVALRHLGSARTITYFSSAPFIGAAIAIFVLGEPPTASFGVALALMLAGTWLAFTERHAHEHTHERMAHSHSHVHDEHHQHAHRGDEGPEPHVHEHAHEPMRHAHPHAPDLHHRHPH